MKVKDAMTSDVHLTNPDETVQQAARLMASLDAGVLPVGENDRSGRHDHGPRYRGQSAWPAAWGPIPKIREIMTQDVKYCFADQDLKDVTQNMGDIQVRRLPVLDHDKRLVGITSLGDIAVMKNEQGQWHRAGAERHLAARWPAQPDRMTAFIRLEQAEKPGGGHMTGLELAQTFPRTYRACESPW